MPEGDAAAVAAASFAFFGRAVPGRAAKPRIGIFRLSAAGRLCGIMAASDAEAKGTCVRAIGVGGGRKALGGVLVALAAAAGAGTNEVATLEPVVVWGARERQVAARVQEAPWTAADAPALSVRGQGAAGTLTDLSVNGSAFSEAGVMFNGATVRNAQTEHFNADLPVPAGWLGRPRVLTGLDLFRVGAGHPAGTLSARLDEVTERGGRATLGAGLDGLVFGRLDDLETFALGAAGRGWIGAFAEAAHADRIDGYDANPMDRSAAGGRFGFGAENWTFDGLVAWQWRDFGCTGAYGANEAYRAWEEDHTGLVSADWRYDAGDDQASEVSFLWTRGRDVYWLKRDQPAFYRNAHLADSVTLHGTTRRHLADWAFVDLRGDADAEVYGTTHRTNYSGTNPKSKTENFRRFHGSVAVLPGVQFGAWEVAAGAAGEFYSDFSGTCAPAGGIAYRFDEEARISLSYREGCRMPSFTELTYDSPDSKGTIGLPLQRTRSLNLDWEWESARREEAPGRFRSARAGAFAMHSEDLVDWLKASPAAGWKATALEPVTSLGVSGDAVYQVTRDLAAIPRGAFVFKETASDYWASRYAMDFPIASCSLELSYRLLDGWRVAYRQGVEAWKSNPVRRGARVRNVSRLETTYELPFCRGMDVSLGLTDLFDQAFEVYPGQRARGFMGYLAVTYRW